VEADFEEFWQRFPRHVGKFAARKAYEKARRIASAQEILDGIEHYKRAKPSYADWCHAATFLNQGRWLDREDRPQEHAVWQCPHQPRCPTPMHCDVQRRIAAGRRAS
jgi:hypothetical protein